MSYSLLNESGDLLTYPDNSLIGIIDKYSDARAALNDLKEAGFPEDEIGILCGAEGAKESGALVNPFAPSAPLCGRNEVQYRKPLLRTWTIGCSLMASPRKACLISSR